MSKYEDTRIVTFKEDFARTIRNKAGQQILDGDGKPVKRVFYKKNSQHAIHRKLVDKLEKQGAKMDVKELDLKKVYAERKKKLQADKKRQAEAAYTQ